MGAAVPYAGAVVIDVSAMDAIVAIDEASLTATVEAGHNGRAFEQALNERGLSFPHFPASAEWASVGGYVAARGSGVLSSRYGKIEDLVVALRVVTPTGEIIDTVPGAAPRGRSGADAALRRLRGHARRHHARHRAADPAARAPPLRGGRDALARGRRRGAARRDAARPPPGGHPLLRRRGQRRQPVAGRRPPARGADRAADVRGRRGVADAEAEGTLRVADAGGTGSSPSSAAPGGSAATTSTTRRTTPRCPRCGARSTPSRATTASSASTTRSAPRSSRSPATACACARTSATGTSGARWSTRAS